MAERSRIALPARWAAAAALMPAVAVLAVCFLGFIAWTAGLSLTGSQRLPRFDFIGTANYAELAADRRFLEAFGHLGVFGASYVLFAVLLGAVLAIGVNQLGGRGSAILQLVFLFPMAMSWLITGLVWQWLLNPGLGLEREMRALGFSGFSFVALVQRDTAIFALVAAAVWHSAGLVMAVLLAGLRSIDADVWRAARLEGVSILRTYRHVALPMLRPYFAISVLLLSFGVVRMFDLVVAMTGGGPGFATDMPALYIQDYMFARGRLGFGAAGAVILMATAALALMPYLAITLRRGRAGYGDA